jgi:hypothetical protein
MSQKMKMDNEIYWRFESMGEPNGGEIGNGPPKQMILQLIQWMTKTTMHRRMQVTLAKSHDELWDRRQQRAEQIIDDLHGEIDELFNDALNAVDGVE